MKKLALSLAVLFSVAMVSCGNSAKEADTTVDTTVAVEETVEADTTVDTTVDDTTVADTNK